MPRASAFFYASKDGDEYLRSGGIYHTKLRPEDMPDWYYRKDDAYGTRFYNAKTVRKLIYRPNYFVDNHFLKDDFLFAVYGKDIPIIETGLYQGDAFELIRSIRDAGHDYSVLWGWNIIGFLNLAEKTVGMDVSVLRKEIDEKATWYLEQNQEFHPEVFPERDRNRWLQSTWEKSDAERPQTTSYVPYTL